LKYNLDIVKIVSRIHKGQFSLENTLCEETFQNIAVGENHMTPAANQPLRLAGQAAFSYFSIPYRIPKTRNKSAETLLNSMSSEVL
jgi:hypothetical protein